MSFTKISQALASASDEQLGLLVQNAAVLGIGGASGVADVDGVPVFVKRIPLTDLERFHPQSTANLFGLPPHCQYGVGGAGFGAWRELAAHRLTTGWVLAGKTRSFPLLYHWRVLPGAPSVPEEHADIEAVASLWDGSPAVRRRLEALAGATWSVALFLEYVPHNLDEWLAAGAPDLQLVERELLAGTAFMRASGLLHFDPHFRNVLTDGNRLLFGDLGLATSPAFELSATEREFAARNAGHDEGYVTMCLVNWLVRTVVGAPAGTTTAERYAYVRRVAAGHEPTGVPDDVAAMIMRHAPLTTVMNDFYWQVFGGNPAAEFPATAVEHHLAARVPGAAQAGHRPG
ncbi:hypothetical protein [Longispora albida]|uniref:hypothetical protein n=1 Tax=Longispora albida TaxID=203523 RepID=UPI000363B9FF|nr:hypothetical protein [Longispora albida]